MTHAFWRVSITRMRLPFPLFGRSADPPLPWPPYAAVLVHDAVHEVRIIRIRVACRGIEAIAYATPSSCGSLL